MKSLCVALGLDEVSSVRHPPFRRIRMPDDPPSGGSSSFEVVGSDDLPRSVLPFGGAEPFGTTSVEQPGNQAVSHFNTSAVLYPTASTWRCRRSLVLITQTFAQHALQMHPRWPHPLAPTLPATPVPGANSQCESACAEQCSFSCQTRNPKSGKCDGAASDACACIEPRQIPWCGDHEP